MISENYSPWLLEVNSSPGMAPTSVEKTKLCAAVMQDTFKGQFFISSLLYVTDNKP